jgi:hypothetical protein
MSRKYPEELKEQMISLMAAGYTNAELSKEYDVHRDTLSYWRENAGLPPSDGGMTPYSEEQIEQVVSLIKDKTTIGEIAAITGVANLRIHEIYNQQVQDGNDLPELRGGVARRSKYSDEDLIHLVTLNQGYGFNRFVQFLRISKSQFFDLLLDFKEFTGEDLYQHLQDTSNHTLVTEAKYMQITGSRQLPRGYGAGTGPRLRRDKKGQNGYKVPLPPQDFIWGGIERNDSR